MLRAVWLISIAALTVAGCNTQIDPRGGKPRAPGEIHRSVISLSPGTTEILTIGGPQMWFKGRTKYDDYPVMAQKVQIVADVKPNYELIATLKPDLVVYDRSLYNDSDLEKIKALGAQTFPIQADTIYDFVVELYKLGSAVGMETSISGYVDKIRQARALAQAGNGTPPKVAILSPGANGSDYIAGKNSFQADLVRAAGGDPVGPDGNRFVPMNAESLVQLNPDAILTAGPATGFVNDPRFATLKAVKSKRVVGIMDSVILRRGSRVDQAIAAIRTFLAGGS